MGHYGKEADIWSAGVILYILLSGAPPFSGNNEQQTFRNVVKQPLHFDWDPWPRISPDAKDCVSRMLQRVSRYFSKVASVGRLVRRCKRHSGLAALHVPCQLRLMCQML